MDPKFNFCNQKQKAGDLQDGLREQAKYKRKLKTRCDRMLLGMKYMRSIAQPHRTTFARKKPQSACLALPYKFSRCSCSCVP